MKNNRFSAMFSIVLFLLSALTLSTGALVAIADYAYSKEILLFGLVTLFISGIKIFVGVLKYVINLIPVSLSMVLFLLGTLILATGGFMTLAKENFYLETVLIGAAVCILSFTKIGYKILCLIIGFDILDAMKNKILRKTL